MPSAAGSACGVKISDVSYPLNRYDAFVFRMALTGDDES